MTPEQHAELIAELRALRLAQARMLTLLLSLTKPLTADAAKRIEERLMGLDSPCG